MAVAPVKKLRPKTTKITKQPLTSGKDMSFEEMSKLREKLTKVIKSF